MNKSKVRQGCNLALGSKLHFKLKCFRGRIVEPLHAMPQLASKQDWHESHLV